MRKILLVLIGGSLLLAACGGGGGSSSAGGEDEGEQGVDVGSVTAVDLPSDFPGDLPLPDDAVAVFVSETDAGSVVWFASAHTFEELDQFYAENIDYDTPWALTMHLDVDESAGTYSLYGVKTDGWTGSIYVGNGGPGATAYTKAYSFRVDLKAAA